MNQIRRIIKYLLFTPLYRSGILFAIVLGIVCFGVVFLTPPLNKVSYPVVFSVEKGESIRDVAENLYEENLITSPTVFILSTYLVGGKILAGTYHFEKSKNAIVRAIELYSGNENTPLKSIYIPDGSNVYEMADIFIKHFPDFDKEDFVERGLKVHGYLYPDTYYFPEETVSPEYVINLMTKTFENRVRDVLDVYIGEYTEKEIISLAAIIELEAPDIPTRKTISGVLWNRLNSNIPLQVDVAFNFINGKHTFTLTREDLRLDDESNTYTNKGVPPLPIANPTLSSVRAAVFPEEHDYFFFLADFAGTTYFSETYQQHLEKKRKYIDSVLKNQ